MRGRLAAVLTGIATLAGAAMLTAQPQAPPAAGELRAAFLKLIDRPRVDPAPAVRPMTAADPSLVQEHFSFSADAGSRITGILIKPRTATGRLPVVIQLHGTGGRKEQMLSRLSMLAARGIAGVAIDARHHGERVSDEGRLTSPYTSAIFAAYTNGGEYPFFFDTVFDAMRLVDYLASRPDIDAARIGLGGVSKGGIETYLTAAVDPRIAAAVPERGVQSFGWALDHSGWDSRAWTIRDALEAAAAAEKTSVNASFVRRFYARVAPGIDGRFDAPAMLPLAAPRPMLVINGDSDPRTPMAGVRLSADAARRAYAAAGAADKFELRIVPDLGHENTPEIDRMMADFFEKQLK